MNRRRFVKNSAIGVIGLPLLSKPYLNIAPSDKIRVAHIGLGNMGRGHLNWFSGFSDVKTVALCDVDQVRLREKYKLLKVIHPDARADTYTDLGIYSIEKILM